MILNILVVVILVTLAGAFAGLTLALFSLKLSTLETKVRMGDIQAKKILKVRKKGNQLLCSLLLGNVASYTIMTIFLDSLTTGVIAGFTATLLIFVFGEILPQAVFPRYAIYVGTKLNWLTWASLILFYPISYPIAWILDKILGKEMPVLWSKEELGEIIKYHEDVGDGIIDKDEERIILGALSFSELKVSDIMIPKKEVFYLDAETNIDENILKKVKEKGYSRIPIYDAKTKKVKGILHTKNLIGAMPNSHVSRIYKTDKLLKVKGTMKLDNLLNLLIQRKIHLALVENESGHFIGVVTLEDIMEEILKIEIDDKSH